MSNSRVQIDIFPNGIEERRERPDLRAFRRRIQSHHAENQGGDRKAGIEKPPAFGASLNTNLILGMAKSGNRVKVLLDIDKATEDRDVSLPPDAA